MNKILKYFILLIDTILVCSCKDGQNQISQSIDDITGVPYASPYVTDFEFDLFYLDNEEKIEVSKDSSGRFACNGGIKYYLEVNTTFIQLNYQIYYSPQSFRTTYNSTVLDLKFIKHEEYQTTSDGLPCTLFYELLYTTNGPIYDGSILFESIATVNKTNNNGQPVIMASKNLSVIVYNE